MVIVGDYNTRDDESARFGGVNRNEIGTYRLIHAVRRLVTGQDLGLKIDPLCRCAYVPLQHSGTEQSTVVFACEFETSGLNLFWVMACGRK
ncbi:phage protein Gp37 [Morganella morganii]|uniref:phage protein Gp37 n=1 Tax=Morganella morganii TaxID=582 RepID=UPI000BFC31E1|nr:phage protein Gp37 [Morganella morganii]PHH11191.1 hypothetical protein CRX48_00875 [Morganella morganii]